jgi:hypothetical protein|tara:strand:- start:360 stop:572 length:213 start_codon:yes stop_codon:yes gene_type:complete
MSDEDFVEEVKNRVFEELAYINNKGNAFYSSHSVNLKRNRHLNDEETVEESILGLGEQRFLPSSRYGSKY